MGTEAGKHVARAEPAVAVARIVASSDESNAAAADPDASATAFAACSGDVVVLATAMVDDSGDCT